MNMDNARILVIGAGVNGSICAVGLHNAGVDVTVLARGKRYEEIRDGGIVIEDPFKNTRSVTRCRSSTASIRRMYTTTSWSSSGKTRWPTFCQYWRDNHSPNVVFMVNNPSGPEEFIRALGRERVMLGFVFGAGKRDGSVIRAIS